MGKSGGKLTCTRFTKEILKPRLALPIRGITPIIIGQTSPYITLMLETPRWIVEEFSMTGCQNIMPDAKGVYELLNSDYKTLRIGEGQIQSRVREHLKDERLTKAARLIRYFVLSDKEETEFFEKVLIAQYETTLGALPQFNPIRA